MMEISSIADAQRHIRNIRRVLLVLTLIIAFYSYVAFASRVSDKIYTTIQSDHYCSRRLNATHQVGCTSDLGGNLGIVWIVQQETDLDHILRSGPTPPYIAVLNREYYTRKNLLEFKANTHRVSGAILLDANHDDSRLRSRPFSPEDRCPNRYSGLYVNDTQYGDCKQNLWQKESDISGILYDDFPYPIFLIDDKKSIEAIEACFNDNNVILPARKQDTYPLCGVQLDSFMLAVGNTETCVNSHSYVDDLLQTSGRRCDVVNNQNIFAYYKTASGPPHPVGKSTNIVRPDIVEAQSVIMLVSKLSSLSMFTDVSPGADSTITSIIALLAISDALGKVKSSKDVEKSRRNIAFALLDSEPFDYTGSSQMVYSMQANTFPNPYLRLRDSNFTDIIQNVNLSSIDYVINLDQVAEYPASQSIYLHSDPLSRDKKKLDRLLGIMKRVAAKESVKLEPLDESLPMPPGPVHEFIKGSQSISKDERPAGFLLSNYGKTYNNLFFNSIYDDTHNIYQNSKPSLVDHLVRVSNFVAKSVYELTFQAEPSGVSVDRALVEQLLECYLVDATCPLFTRAWQAGQQLPRGPILTYKDPTKNSDDMNGMITMHLLAYFIGDKLSELNMTSCYRENEDSMIYHYHYANGRDHPITDINSGVCVRSQVQMTPAQSPAFTYNQEAARTDVDRKYPAWTVSLDGIRNPVRLFLKPSPVYQWCVFATGIVVTAMSFIVVQHIGKSIADLKSQSPTGTST